MKNDLDKKLQVVAFSTSDSTKTPNDVINIFLGTQNHKIIKKSRHSIAFSINLKNSSKDTTIMVYSILNLTREYTGINDVNCYLLFIDLEKEDSIKKLTDIIEYAKDFCDLMKKIYVVGMISGVEENKKFVNKSDVSKILGQEQVNYEYKEINLKNTKEVSDVIMEVINYSSKHSIDDGNLDKEGGQAKSCEIF